MSKVRKNQIQKNTLCVKNLNKEYVVDSLVTVANKNISFEACSGDVIWIHGRSGSGKTTLMNMITTLDSPTSGSIEFLGKNYKTLRDKEFTFLRRDKMGLMFQHFELLPMLNGYENIRVPYLIGKCSGNKKTMKEQASNEIIDSLVLQIRSDIEFLAKKVTKISGGQRQIINIIRAIVHHPPFIIGDEITANLDSEQSHKVYAMLRSSIIRDNSIGVFISHDPIIEKYCTRTFDMKDGVLTEFV